MIRLLGFSASTLSLGLAIYGAAAAFWGVRTRNRSLVASARGAAYAIFGLMLAANLGMVYALLTHDFSISYVAQVGSRSTPTWVTIISLWSSLEGSILFWGLILAGFTAAVVYLHRDRDNDLFAVATGTMLIVGAFFYLLLVGPANPFQQVFPVPADGPGPNPLLQNHWLMAVHPPLLYLGYVGMVVPFGFAIGALITRQTDDRWLRVTRRWTLTAWAFLTLAIVAGMWWSYEVLGWGGYWAWDPVENASFLPWLTATAFIHSMMVQERRGMLKVWNVSLIISTFLLTILGTFLTRSGILSSVHAFAEGDIGYYFLGFIALTLMASVAIIAGRSEELRSTGRLQSAASRETVFLLNNLVLAAFTFTVLLGTLFPLVAEAIRGVRVTVGEPFFNRMTLPLAVMLIFLVGVGPVLPWGQATEKHFRRFVVPGVVGVLGAVVWMAVGGRHLLALLGIALAAFAITANLGELWIGMRARMRAHGENPLSAAGRLVMANSRRYGGYIAHLGILIVSVGIIASSSFTLDHEFTLSRGETAEVGDYTLRFDDIWGSDEARRFSITAELAVLKDERQIGTLRPKLNYYRMSDQPIATPAVRTRAHEDLYLTLMAFEEDGETVTIRALVEPLVGWIWVGALIIGTGAFVALQYRSRRADDYGVRRTPGPGGPGARRRRPREGVAA
ncbi:MAG: heme lyase CcmF/NrfE family subunit [Gemmatimonadetes bacterium]|nr:heme lyase CcmF/NrfE family subunit [Gemmatimonadota bacterium]NIQ53513.1 heme lyase CcmF/NrfE family subunit [Gemmatimonadota bacterium]NIU73655.1 heme lyase CcmF/NrfE family subunit [Gammaproteobacteria bacterium]NIX43833.1 heme lyase CcmF/NrfE family subunit [Gemmatimonadota bacterium]NIY08037.1 heme lyase CcmF/NrfE family subunit [Gemmatimonadota bacterium]